MRHCLLVLEARKWLCRACGHGFRQQFPGILKWQRASEAFRRMIFFRHWDGISRRRLGQREGLSSATIERWFQYVLKRLAAERRSSRCPAVLGIDEHVFSRRHGFATTLCDVKNHTVYDVVLGRSEASLEGYFPSLEGKGLVRVVCMDLASVYRAIVRKHFPNALIVADRFHVIRLINHHFLGCWRDLDAVGSKNRGLLSRMRRHRHNLQPAQSEKLAAYLAERPALELIYRFKQRLCYLLLKKHRTRKQCQTLIPATCHPPTTTGRPGPTGSARPDSGLLVPRDRRHVAIHQEQRNHRRLPHQDGTSPAASLRVSQLPKLPLKS